MRASHLLYSTASLLFLAAVVSTVHRGEIGSDQKRMYAMAGRWRVRKAYRGIGGVKIPYIRAYVLYGCSLLQLVDSSRCEDF